MPVGTTVHVVTPNVWTPLNAGQAAAANVSLYHKSGGALLILVSTSSSAPTYNQSTVDAAFAMEPAEEIIGTTCALMAPDLATPQYLYAAPRDGMAGSLLVRTA